MLLKSLLEHFCALRGLGLSLGELTKRKDRRRLPSVVWNMAYSPYPCPFRGLYPAQPRQTLVDREKCSLTPGRTLKRQCPTEEECSSLKRRRGMNSVRSLPRHVSHFSSHSRPSFEYTSWIVGSQSSPSVVDVLWSNSWNY